MKTYEVLIAATVLKTITVNADDEDKANEEAHEQFSVPMWDKYYGLDTLRIEEVKS